MSTTGDAALLAIVGGHQPVGTDETVHEQVIDGALAALLDFGIKRTTMNEIARRSGVSPASLYRWYGTKDTLVAAVGIRETQRFLAELEAGVDLDAPPDEQLAEVSVQVARRLRNQPLLRRLIETEPEAILPRLTTDGAPIIEAGAAYLTAHIQRLMDEGRVERFDPRPLAEMLARVTHSLLLTPSTATPQDDDAIREAARDSIRWLLHLPPKRS